MSRMSEMSQAYQDYCNANYGPGDDPALEDRVAKPWLNGEPYYCKLCGAGGQERMQCEWPTCELEDAETARARVPPQTAGMRGES